MHRMPDMQSVALGIWINIGGRYESFEKKGISHFFEHLVFKGTKEYSCRKIKELIEGAGGSLNGFTSEELTCYLVKIPSKYLELALDVLSSMTIDPLVPEPEVKREKTVILEEIKMYKDQPQSYVYELLDELLWPAQPLGAPVIGTVKSVSSITMEDLRSFKQEHYTAQNIVVSAAGLLDYDKFKKIVSKKFLHLKKKKSNVWEKAEEKQEIAQIKIFDKDTEQTHMALGFHSFRRDHPLRHALGLLHVILGANMSSRLFNEIREKRGLAYEIGTSVKRFQDTGVFIVHAGIDNNKVSEAIKLILRELEKCKNELVSIDEFRRAKEFYLGQLMLALEDTLEHMLWIGESTATLDKTYSSQDILKEVNKISREDIREAAKFIFNNKGMNLALIGPLKDQEGRIRNQLKIN